MARIILNELGIGDVICSLYALQAYANCHPNEPLDFYLAQHLEWVGLANIDNLTCQLLVRGSPPSDAISLYDEINDPGRKLRHTTSPKELFAQALGVKPVRPSIKNEVLCTEPIFPDEYVVIAPFASRLNRSWPLAHWKLLSEEMGQRGIKVIAVDGPFQNSRCEALGVEFYYGQSAPWVANVCAHAKLVIGNDSGIAHLAGWLGVKCLVIMTQLQPEQYYDYTNNNFVTGSGNCCCCNFLPEKGYKPICDYYCNQLNLITPEGVLERALSILNPLKQDAFT